MSIVEGFISRGAANLSWRCSAVQESGLRICKLVRRNSRRQTGLMGGSATHMQLPRIVAVVLEGYTAMLTLFMCVDCIWIQSQVCPSTIAITLRKRSASAVGIRAYGKASSDDSGILINQPCLRHLTGVTSWKAFSNIARIALRCSRW